MPGKDEPTVENQEPTNEENENEEEEVKEEIERYEDRVIDAITGVSGSGEE